jgi:hypothetical protein
MPAAEAALPTSRFASASDPVGGAGGADAHVGQARSPQVLQGGQRIGGQHPKAQPGQEATSTNRTVTPGRSSAGGSRDASKTGNSVRPISCHPPGDMRGYTPV